MNPPVQKPFSKILICLVLAGITFAAFAGVFHSSFITLDDGVYVVANPPVQHGFSSSSVKWAFQTVHAGFWIPMTWLSHILDCQLYGLNPAGHHVTNLLFHIANTLLLFILMQKLTARMWPSAFVALLFGIHPMHVESVAWVTERKDVLSAFFFLLALLAYTRYAESARGKPVPQSAIGKTHSAKGRREIPASVPGTARVNPQSGAPKPGEGQPAIRNRKWGYYALALVLFALGLMSKPMLVTLPFVLLLLDFWPLQRVASMRSEDGRFNTLAASKRESETLQRFNASTLQRVLVEKLPFFLLSAFFSYVEILAGRNVGAVKPAFEFSLADRLGHVPISYVWYLLKFFWPANLSVFYILHTGTDTPLKIAAAVLLLLVITGFALALARKFPYLLFGWLWFLGMLVPVIGFVQAGDQAYADRFSYLPYIGLFVVIAWGVPDLLAGSRLFAFSKTSVATGNIPQPAAPKPGEGGSSILHPPSPAFLWAGAIIIGVVCFWRTVEEVRYWKDGPTLFKRTLALYPNNEMAWALLGAEYEIKGNSEMALDCIKRSLSLNSRFNHAWEYLGYFLEQKKDYAGAENAYKTALSQIWYKEDRIDTYNRLGDTFALDTKYAEAVAAYQSSLALEANQPAIQARLGQTLMKNNQPDKAAVAFQTAIEFQPDNADAHVGLGMISQSSGLDSDAVAEYRKALDADPDSLIALNNLAWLLATDSDPALRNGANAVSLAEHACQLTHYTKAFMIGTLAAAYAEAGRFDDAVTAAQKAHDVALANGEKDLAGRNSQLLQLYQSHKPYRETSKTR